jgi:hypothetical protein
MMGDVMGNVVDSVELFFNRSGISKSSILPGEPIGASLFFPSLP